MITPLLRAVTMDVLGAVSEPSFFSLTKTKKANQIGRDLSHYPEPIVAYAQSISDEAFVSDLSSVVKVLGGRRSVLPHVRRLHKEENGFVHAFLDSLNLIRQYADGKTHLGVTMESFRSAGSTYRRVLDREMQLLLLFAKNQDSPMTQIASPVELDMSELPGVPTVEVNPALLGGGRMFYNGKLTDSSWRGRLTKVLSAIS